jgi:hypothetical protein
LLAGQVTLATELISPHQAAELTVFGANASANADKTIPPYLGEKIALPGGWQSGQNLPNPFETDQPEFTISADNQSRYAPYLAEGQKALLTRNAHYQLPVYRTKRTMTLPEFILEGTAYNAKHARLQNEGSGLTNFKQGIPFPSLDGDNQTAALQSIWNHIARYRGGNIERRVIQATVFDDDKFVPIKFYQRYTRAEHLAGTTLSDSIRNSTDGDSNILFYYLDRIISPSRLSGATMLIHETLDQSKEKRRAWVYSQAYRRVRRAPAIAYDTPGPSTYGLRTADSYDMYNGSPDKYLWQYHGKQELYIPYNAYRLASDKLEYKDILAAKNVESEHTRWELHRVHKVEAVLKDGQRHIYARRIFYLDEDSWSIVLAEQYDHHGQLWRVSEGHVMNFYDQEFTYYAMEVTYDLLSNRYIVFGLNNEEPFAYKFERKFQALDYMPSALRRNSRG